MTRRLTDAARTLSSQVIVGRVLLACTQMRHRSCSCPRGSGENCHDGEGEEQLGGGTRVTGAGADRSFDGVPAHGPPSESLGLLLVDFSSKAQHRLSISMAR